VNGGDIAIWRPDPEGDWSVFQPAGFRVDAPPMPLHFTPGGRALLFSAVVEGGTRAALYRLTIKGMGVLPLYSDPVVDVDDLVLDLSGRTAIGVSVEPDRPQHHWLQPEHPDAKLYQLLEQAFPGHAVRITSASRDGRRAVVFVRSDIDPGQYYLFDTQSKHAEFLLASSEWVDPRVLRAREPIELPARDGLVLHGYLTRPSDAPGPFPLVVLQHGGPHGVRDRWGYDWEAELLASRGYAVLQVNYRGSSGYGVDFERAGYGEWGGKMQDDLTDATRWAIAQHFTAADDICIFGASYGGYAALMGVVREPELYQCAVGYAGVYDLELLYRRRSMRGIDMYARYLDRVLGTDAEQQRARSPVNNAGRISVPVLLVHGKADTTAEFEQAKRMRDALEAAHKPYEWLAVGREGHGVYDEENRVEVYTKILDFLGRHLHPIASSAATSAAGS
jgi:dipeptidyl aminopeptidase/acylaminoacyl peptidase